MEKHKKLKTNMIYSGAYQILAMIVPVITTPYVTRIFSPNQMGIYGASLALVTLVVILSMLGLPLYGTREIASNEENRSNLFFSMWKIQAVSTLSVFFVFNLIIFLLPIQSKKIYTLQSFLILISIFDVSWFFIGIEEIKKTIFRNFSAKLLSTVLIFFVVKDKNDLNLYILVNVLGMFVGNMTMVFELKNWVSYEKTKSFSFFRSKYKEMFALLIPQFLNSFRSSGDRNILQLVGNNYSVGVYDQGKKIITVLMAVVSSVSNAILPRMSELFSKGKTNEVKAFFDKSIVMLFSISLIFINGMFSTSNSFVSLFFGSDYSAVADVLEITSLTIFVLPVNLFMYNGLILPMKKDKTYNLISRIGVITIFTLNFVFDKRMLFIGASISFVVTEFILFFVSLYSLKKFLDAKKIIKLLVLAILLCGGSIIVTRLILSRIIINGTIVRFLIQGIISVASSSLFVFGYFKLSRKM